MLRRFQLSILFTALVFSSGCSLLVGNVKTVDEKSDDYRYLDLARDNDDWEKLAPEASMMAETTEAPDDPGQGSSEASDVAYQSKRTSAIISMNTACRPTLKRDDKATDSEREQHLRTFTAQLLLGLSDIENRSEKIVKIQETPALETTLTGRLSGKATRLRTVVLRHLDCIYDLMYIARPSVFEQQEPDFARFVASLRLRR